MGVIVLLVPLVIVPVILIGRRLRTLSRASQDRIADTSGLAGETFDAISTVQAFTLERLQSERFGDAVGIAFKTAVRRIRVRALLTATHGRIGGREREPDHVLVLEEIIASVLAEPEEVVFLKS